MSSVTNYIIVTANDPGELIGTFNPELANGYQLQVVFPWLLLGLMHLTSRMLMDPINNELNKSLVA
jgi:hypothetical protein